MSFAPIRLACLLPGYSIQVNLEVRELGSLTRDGDKFFNVVNAS
jgi:hypothetical protein